MNSGRIALLLVGVLAVPPLNAVPKQASSDSAQQVSAFRDQWVKDWKTRNLEDLRTLYARDATFLPADESNVMGRDAIGDYLEQMIKSTIGDLILVSDRSEASGDLAYDAGFIQYWLVGQQSPVKGFYITVLRRTPSGKLVIVQQAFTGISSRRNSPSK